MTISIVQKYKSALTKFNGKLIKPYQDAGVRWMIIREHDFTPGGILCDEMGLGKTAQTICTILSDPRPTSTLILCPKSVIDQWVSEIYKFAPHLKEHVLVYGGPNRSTNPDVLSQYRIVIGSLGMAVSRKYMTNTTLHKVKWHRVIVDEAHDIRTTTSKSYKSLRCLDARVRWCLTGTPIYNRECDFRSLMKWIGVRSHVTATDFRNCIERYVLRRTKDDIDSKLPSCTTTNVMIDLEGAEAELYKKTFDRAVRDIERVPIYKKLSAIGMAIFRCRYALACPSAYAEKMNEGPWTHGCKKAATVVSMITKHPDEKTLIFCNYHKEMDMYTRLLKDKSTYHIDGTKTQKQRKETIEKFRADPTGAVFLIQIKSGGVGLNLQEATRVYITSPAWSPATEIQAIGRSHRTGQTKEVHVYRMITKDISDQCRSIEDSMIQLQECKTEIFKTALPNIGEMGKIPSMGKKDVEAIKILFMTEHERERIKELRKPWETVC